MERCAQCNELLVMPSKKDPNLCVLCGRPPSMSLAQYRRLRLQMEERLEAHAIQEELELEEAMEAEEEDEDE